MKTYTVKKSDLGQKEWLVVDATDAILGRTASLIAKVLLGKNKAKYAPDADVGDHVIVVNADKLRVTGNKFRDKVYYTHSGRVGNLKEITFEKLIQKSPEKLLRVAVKGMLPKNTRGRDMLKKLKIYSGSEHPHLAQQPKNLELNHQS